MIGYVRGVITHIFAGACYVDVHGVGYRVYVPASTLQKLQIGKEATLFTHMSVREDAMQLYGFISEAEYDLFMLLISVSKLGGKIANGMLSAMSPEAIKIAIANGQVTTLTKLPGIGKKMAERIVLELKDKIGQLGYIPAGTDLSPTVLPSVGGILGEVVETLMALGYSEEEIKPVLSQVDTSSDDVGKIVGLVLAYLGKGK